VLKAELAQEGCHLEDRDVPHTGCCKAYSLVALLIDEFGARGAWEDLGSNKPPTRLQLDKHVRALRAPMADALDAQTLALLRSGANSNRAGWLEATDLENAKLRVAISYDAGRKAGFSMSPIWLEEWETSVVCRRLGVVVLELHSACTSNQGRSHFQVVTPNQGRPNLKVKKVSDEDDEADNSDPFVFRPETEVLVVRRIQCHYHPVWVDGKPRSKFGDLPLKFKEQFFPAQR